MKDQIYILLMIVFGVIIIISSPFAIKTTIIPPKCPITFGCGGTSVLSWWDYGDWINWNGGGFGGNMSTVLRGDNQVPSLDYATAYQFINGNATSLASFMKQEHAKLWLISSDDFEKIDALSYLSCWNWLPIQPINSPIYRLL